MPIDIGKPNCDLTWLIADYLADNGVHYGLRLRATYVQSNLGLTVASGTLPRPPRRFRPRRLHIEVLDTNARDNGKTNQLVRRKVVFNTSAISGGIPQQIDNLDGIDWTVTGYTGERMTAEF